MCALICVKVFVCVCVRVRVRACMHVEDKSVLMVMQSKVCIPAVGLCFCEILISFVVEADCNLV